ncbi:hypothetical protein, partial [Aeromonas allosaccharophila]|uniref:hypothetical protein n=1 Tax=Aeromonas allosaccharophila TaxID=656 RepID=UPI003AF5E83B
RSSMTVEQSFWLDSVAALKNPLFPLCAVTGIVELIFTRHIWPKSGEVIETVYLYVYSAKCHTIPRLVCLKQDPAHRY